MALPADGSALYRRAISLRPRFGLVGLGVRGWRSQDCTISLYKDEESKMSTTTLDISEARKQFTKLDKRLREDQVIWVTRRNKRAFAVVDSELLQTVLETIEILSDPEALGMLQRSMQDIKAGRLHDHEAVSASCSNEYSGTHPVDANRA